MSNGFGEMCEKATVHGYQDPEASGLGQGYCPAQGCPGQQLPVEQPQHNHQLWWVEYQLTMLQEECQGWREQALHLSNQLSMLQASCTW